MLQLLLITVGFSLANCQGSPRIIETSYKDGKEYIYDYESQILSGLPMGARTWSGLKLKSNILVQTFSPWKFKLQMRSPCLYKINDFLDTREPTKEMLPVELFKELLDDESENMKLHILKPVKFSYVRGHVEDLVTEEDDPEWSVDIKRAVLSLLEMNFNERHSLSRDVPVLLSDSQPKMFKVFEPSVVGECETRYRIEPQKSIDDVPGMKVNKLRDHNRCIEKVVHMLDILNSRICDTCDKLKMQDPISSQSSVRYQLLGSPDQFMILSAVSESQYSFAPYSQDLGTLSTVSNQTLFLVDSRPISKQISDPSSPLEHEQPLKVKRSDTENPALSPRTLKMKKEEKSETLKMIEKVLKGIEQLMLEKVDEEIGELLSELTRLLKTLDKPSLDTVLDDLLGDNKKLPKARKVFMDILPSVGTYPSIDVLLERLGKEKIPKQSMALAMMTLSFLPKPDVFIVERLMDFLEKKDVKEKIENKMLRRSAWLTLGSLGDKMVKVGTSSVKDLDIEKKIVDELRGDSNDQQIRKKLDRRLEQIGNKRLQLQELYTTTKKKIIDMVQKLHELEDSDSKRLSMKVMASLGYEEFIPTLESIVRDQGNPEQTRIEAAISMFDTVKMDPEKVEKIYLPLCLDWNQPDIVRMTAFSVVLFAERSRSALEMIVKSLEDEPNDNVASFVYSSLLEMSKLSTPCDGLQSLAWNSSLAKRFAKKSPHPKSTMMARSSYNEHLQMGHTYTHFIHYSPDERSPSLFVAKYTAALLGRSTDVLELMYSGKGLDSVLDQLLDASAGTSLEAVLKTVLHPRHKRHTVSDSEQKIKYIKEKIGVKPREPRMPEGYIGLRLFGHELIYLDTGSLLSPSEQTSSGERQLLLDSIKDKLSLVDSLKTFLNTHKSLMLPLLHATVPTDTGLPLKIRIDKHVMVKLDGDMKLVSNPKTSKKKSLFSKIDALLNIRPSGLLELRGRMEVDMKHVRSGVSVKGKVYTDVPLKMTVNVDPENSKLLVKLQDEKDLTPLKFESVAQTEIRRFPSTADKYPIPPERKEISHIDGSDPEVIMYEVGKDVLGRSFKLMGMRSLRKDSSVPLPPMSGKQQIYFKYEPLSDTGLQIQLQHVSESETGPEQKEKAKSGSSWFPFSSWFSSSEASSEGQVPMSHPLPDRRASSEESIESSDDSDFINLEERDLTIGYLKDKLMKDTDVLKFGSKCGMVIHIVDSKPEPKHEVQLSTLYQRDHSSRKVSYTMELRRRPKPDEEKPWKVVTDMRLELPERHLEPSDLLDNEYQKQVLEQIKLSVSENGRLVDSFLDLGSGILKKTAKQMKNLQKPDSLLAMIEGVVDHVLQNSLDSNSKPMKDAVFRQRKVLRDVTKFSKQPVNPMRIPEISKNLVEILEKSKLNLDKVSKMLSQTSRGEQKPENSVEVLYILISKEKINRKLKKVIEKLQPVLLLTEKKDLEAKLKEQELSLESIKDQQMKHSVDKQPSELQKSRLEIDPDDRSLHSKLLDIEQKLISLSEKKSQYKRDGITTADIDSSKHSMKEIITASSVVKDKLDAALLQKGKLDRMLRVKVFEVLLHQKLALLDIKNEIKSIEKKSRTMDLSSLKVSEDDLKEDQKKELIRQKEDLTRKAEEIAERLVLAIESEKERKTAYSQMSSDDVEKLTALTKIQVQQLNILDGLKKKYTLPFPSTVKEQPSKEYIQKYMDTAKETSEKLKDVIDQESRDIMLNKKALLNPVLIKSLKLYSEQSDILQTLKQIIEEKILTKALMEDPEIASFRELKKIIEKLEEDTIKDMKRTERLLKTMVPPEPVFVSDSLYSSNKSPVPVTVLLKRTLKIDVQHSDVRPLLSDLVQSLDQPAPRDKLAQLSKSIQNKQLLYNIISKLLVSQDEFDKIQTPLEDKVKTHLEDDQVADLLRVVSEKQADQFSLVRTLEKKLIDKSKSDLSLVQPLQTIQQLKDRIQRQQHEVKLLHQPHTSSPMNNQGRALPMKSWSPQQLLNTDITGVMKIMYGEEEKERRIITIRFFGKKSLKQLLWEHDQSLPSMQDRVLRQYFSDRLEPNDPTAMGYRTIKDKLNTYRHLHAFVAYEDSLPMKVRELMWKLHELLKLKLYTKVELLMPDNSNMRNKLEIKSDLSIDDRWIDVEIKTPSETTRFRNIPTPDMVKRMSMSDSMEQTLLSSVCIRHLPATCEISPDRVKSFTGKTFEVDLKSQPCESVLTMDCSPGSKMAITSKPHPEDPARKVITILTKDMKVEIIPDPSSMKVKVDGKPITMPTQPGSLRILSDNKKPMIVREIGDNKVEMKLPHDGLSVLTDGRKVSVKVPQTYWSKLCGVCGSLDGHMPEELFGPQKVKYSDPQPFVSTYLVPDSQCDPKPLHNKLGVLEIREKSKQVPPLEETEVKEKRINGIRRMCFSTRPVKKCPPNSTPEGIVNQLVPFYCLRARSSNSEIYQKLARSRVLYEVRDKRPDMHENITMPKLCVKQ